MIIIYTTLLKSNYKIIPHKEVQSKPFESLKSFASRNDPKKQKDLMYLEYILCHEGANDNADWFFRDELESAYYSAVHKVYNWEHAKPIIGTITDSVLVKASEDDEDARWRIEVSAVVWKFLFGDYASKIKAGAEDGTRANSMECYFSDYVYVLGDESDIRTRDEINLDMYIGGEYEGKKVYRGLKGVLFAGAGCVTNPADTGAIFKSVASSQKMDISNMSLEDVEREVGKLNGEELKADASECTKVSEDAKSQGLEGAEAEVNQEDVQEVKETETEAKQELEDNQEAEANQEVESNQEAEASQEDVQEQECKQEAEVEHKIQATIVDSLLNEWAIENSFWDSFEALSLAINTILFDDSADKTIRVLYEIQSFANVVAGVLPKMVEYYHGEQAKILAGKEKDLTENINTLQDRIENLTKEYNSYKSQVESEKRESQLDALAEKRLENLAEAGLVFSEKRLSSVKEKVKNQSDSEFQDFKELLLEAKQTANLAQARNKADASYVGLNVASNPPQTVDEKFKTLVERMFKN